MIDRILKIFPWVIGIIILINVLLLDFWSLEKTGKPLVINETPKTQETLNCSTCQQIISEEVQKALPAAGNISGSVTPIPTTKTTPTPTPTTAISSNLKVLYVPIGTTGATINTDWTDIGGTDFYFNLTDYPGVKSVRWELSLQTDSANNNVYARLYDVTNKRGVDNSQLSTSLAAYEFLRSGDLTIWNGNNLYRIQIKGLNGNTVNFLNPKLKIVFN
jgi:hypothetical protein